MGVMFVNMEVHCTTSIQELASSLTERAIMRRWQSRQSSAGSGIIITRFVFIIFFVFVEGGGV